MRVDSVYSRGKSVYVSIFWGIVLALINWSVAFNEQLSEMIHFVNLFYYLVVFICICLDLFSPLAVPVRFHRKNQEVYVYNKKVLYRIPWSECEMSCLLVKNYFGGGTIRNGYELVLWLDAKHAVKGELNNEKPVRLLVHECFELHTDIYYWWTFIRSVMDLSIPRPYPISKGPEIAPLGFREPDEKRGLMGWLIKCPLQYIFIFFASPKFISHMHCPFRGKWPEEVHEWTGEKCNWL